MFTDVVQVEFITAPRQAGLHFPDEKLAYELKATGEVAAGMSLLEAQVPGKALAFARKYFETVLGIPSEYMVCLWISSVEANIHLLS